MYWRDRCDWVYWRKRASFDRTYRTNWLYWLYWRHWIYGSYWSNGNHGAHRRFGAIGTHGRSRPHGPETASLLQYHRIH